jgi:CxxC-x17-CxxC domain-containing protein
MHQATCATCGKSCEVPFRPTGERPVYCRDCFSGTAGAPQSAGRREYPKRPFPPMPAPQAPDPRIDDVLRQLVKVQDKLERILLSLAVAKAQSTMIPETVAVKPKRRTRKK